MPAKPVVNATIVSAASPTTGVRTTVEVDRRDRVPTRARDHPGEPDHGHRQPHDHGHRRPTEVGRADQRVGQRAHADDEPDRAEHVGPAGALDDVVRQHPEAPHQGDQPDRHVDEEDPVPGRLDEQATERRPERGGDRADRGPRPDRVPAALGGVGREQQGQRRRRDERGAEGLHRPRGDEQADRRGDRTGDRGGREHREPDEEDPAVPDTVGQAPGEGEEGREHHRVAVEDPRDVAEVGAREVRPDVGEGDVDDEQVEAREEGRRRRDEQDGARGRGHRSPIAASTRRPARSTAASAPTRPSRRRR